MTIGFSPCPNDTFIFDAMLHGKVDCEGLVFEPIIEDVEALNRRAFAGELDITKLSYHAFAHLTNQYMLLNAGSALGNNCGPLLVAREALDLAQINAGRIAIPGKMTTANFLLSLAYPEAQNKAETLFSDIEKAVLDGSCEAGLIIHENRFTYEQLGLKKIIDLGEFWETTTGMPIPLGGIVVNRRLDTDIQQKVDRILRRSVTYAFDNPESVMPYVRMYAQAMDDRVMQSHIDLYVTQYTIDLGAKGREAIAFMLKTALDKGVITSFAPDYLVAA